MSRRAVEPTHESRRDYTAEVVAVFPHAPDGFTQGLEFYDGFLYESTGLNGYSTLRVVEVATGRVLRSRRVDEEHYAEGLTVYGGRVYQLTLHSQRCFVYNAETLELEREHGYQGEGWGLSHDARSLIMSDGTHVLRYLNPSTFTEERRVSVFDGATAVELLNELEMVNGELLANVWRSDRIARIDPESGRVLGWIDLGFLRRRVGLAEPEAVLNGIAYEASTRRLLVTGKLWPTMFEIALRRSGLAVEAARSRRRYLRPGPLRRARRV